MGLLLLVTRNFLIILLSYCCYGDVLNPFNKHYDPNLLDLKNLIILPHPHPEQNLTLFQPNRTVPQPLLSRKKRIIAQIYEDTHFLTPPHQQHDDPSSYYPTPDTNPTTPKIYVTEDGEDPDKSYSSGPWSKWMINTDCSRTCGGGVAVATRTCGNSTESNNEILGSCEGPSEKYTSCNTHACSSVIAVDFRAEQCSAYNNVPFEGRFYTWLPYTRAPNKCELNCMPQGERFYYRHKRKVIDGTSCGVDLICVNGNCLPVGCDGILGSRKRQDKCRVCGGDGSSCNTVQGVFDSNDLQVGYNDVLLIPAGATNIVVRETQATNNYLAIRNTSGHYYLNGNWRIDFPREIQIASTTFHYERKPHTFFAPETIRALGPISEAIYIVILYQESNPGITFEYSVPRGVVIDTEPGTEYAWIYGEWGGCSRECGGGTQTRTVNCARRSPSTLNWDYVEPHLCDDALKPETFKYCNYEIPCPVRWHISTWDECTAPCGSNITGTQIRNVFCEQEIQGVSALVENEKCVESHGPAPEKLRNCTSTKTDECTSWFVGEWEGCSSLCGDGYDRRVVRCVSKDELGRVVIHGDEKCVGGKPEEYSYCFLVPCDGVDWVAEGSWGECKVPSTPTCSSPSTANQGTQSREVYCSDAKGKVYDDKFCHSYRKPNTTQSCKLDFDPAEDPSCKYTWYATQWTDCQFQSCSDGVRGKMTRRVYCGTVISGDSGGGMEVVGVENCNETKKYSDAEDCVVGYDVVDRECGDEEARLRKGRWFSGPWGECSKPCGGGRRTRTVLCMVGNRTTTDVKICGEDDVLFTSEDCNTVSCDDLSPEELEAVTDDSLLQFTEEDTSESSAGTEEPCEPWTDEELDYYEDYYEDEVMIGEALMITRGSRSVFSTTTEMVGEDGGTTEGVTMDTSDGVTTSEGDGVSTGAFDDVGEGSGSSSTEGSVTGVSTDDDGVSTMGMEGSSVDMGTGTTVTGDVAMTSSSTEGMSTESVVMTTTAGVVMSTTTEAVAMTTTTEAVTTTTEAVTTTTTEAATTSTTESITTTSEPPTTTTLAPETTTVETSTTAQVDVTRTTTTVASEMSSTSVVGSTGMGMDSTTVSSESMGTGSTETAGVSSATELVPDYDLGDGAPPMRLVDGSSTTEDSMGGSTDESFTGMEEEDSAVTEDVEYVTDYMTEVGFTTIPTVTLPKCKRRPKAKKVPSNCHKSPFGCCPDGEGVASGPFGGGCKIAKSCEETEWGCCEDGVRVAGDRRKKSGCGVDCKKSLFGCCGDGKSVAKGNSGEGCVKDCGETQFGCCLDGKTAKKGPKGRNCPKIPCKDAIYGCCPDNKTPALGPNFKDCKEINLDNCKANYFGCCIDGITSALGDNEEGCPDTPPCARTEHGCCPDGVTSAHGKNNEGCCASSRFGCCADNIAEAKGFDFEGCDCNASLYGCCPDGVTPARGESQDCGCKFTEFGCCPDGVSPASGNDNEGCGCSTFQYGCCPDGVSVAKGRDNQGCGCLYTEWGCCPDGRTPKIGEGVDCGCEASVFGCCPDGVSSAKGDDFEGCEDVPIKPGEVCGLEKERGSCRNFTVRWFFDMEYGGCSRFWWGGCEGNLNRFGSQDECRSVCVEPEGRDACYLPRVSGPCEGYYPSWYYDPQRESCEQFIYSGCLGNNNRFGSKQECENHCLVPERVDDCDQPRTEGPCRGNYSRYYYDKTSEKCELFTYGGCKGNSNNFLTEKECHQRCGKDIRMRDVCFQPRSEGPCHEKLPRWYYDGGEQRCVPFYYSGCQGNSNRFGSLDECEKTCPAALLGEARGCLEPLSVGDCGSFTERYYFDRYEGKCKTFIFSGCGGNTNNFISIDDCRTKCESFVPKPVASSEDQQFSQAHCSLPPPDDPNSCPHGNTPPTVRWYYNSHDGVCSQFRYYCSNSSLNNFDTRQDCEDKCGDSQDYCSLPKVVGPCTGRFLQYYYDQGTDGCLPFEYSGCSGNGNRFDTVGQCEQRCKRGSSPHHHHEDTYGRGGYGDDEEERRRVQEEEERRRAYDEEVRRRAQQQLVEEEDARRRGEDERRRQEGDVDQGHHRGGVSQEDICYLDVDQGPCRAAVKAFHFDRGSSKCVEFLYGGCGGNANRFESEEMCERQCGGFRGQDVCNQTPDPGPCTSDNQKVSKWYFNTADQACAVFVYSGCGGNGNRFSSREECESVCYSRNEIISSNDTITGAAICRLPPDTGPCVDGFKRWYYNPDDKTCIPFVFGGCAGNLNRFKSFNTCVQFCEKALGYTYRGDDGGSGGRRGVDVRSGDDSESNGVIGGGGGRNHYNYYADDNNNAPCDCSYIKCPYGISPQNSTYSCVCECYDPCRTTYCPDPSSRCSVDIQGGSYVPVCRSARKPGSCPQQQQSHHHTRHHHGDRICDSECSSDADCSGDLKCCGVGGCGASCVVAVVTSPYEEDRGEEAGGVVIRAVTKFVNVSVGGLVEVECVARGAGVVRPDIIWGKVDSNEKITGESGRFRITESQTSHDSVTSKLQIVGPNLQDTGTYECIASSQGSPPTSDTTTVVIHETTVVNPAAVLEDVTLPTTQLVSLGTTANLRCFALGWPKPSVTWWRGERMLPFSSERYEQMRDYSLVVRLVGLRDLGVYTCQAYNGLGRAASWSVSLVTYGPVKFSEDADREYLVYVLDGVGQHGGGGGVVDRGVGRNRSVVTTTTTTTERYVPPTYYVPLRATISSDRVHYNTGQDVRVSCEVEGYPHPVVRWYKDDVLLDLYGGDRRLRFDPPTLTIQDSNPSNSGSYRCEATNEHESVTSSILSITVAEETNLHVNCTDNSFFANCKLIVKANYCTNKYYARFCCKSCTLAGQLPQFGPHLMEAGQAYFSRGSSSNRGQGLFGGSSNRGVVGDDEGGHNELFSN